MRTLFFTLSAAVLLLVGLSSLQTRRPIPTSSEENKTMTFDNPVQIRRPARAQPSERFEQKTTELESIPPEEVERMHRMADNLLKPQLNYKPAIAEYLRSQWRSRFLNEPNPLTRQEIVTEMTQLDDPLTINLMIDLLKTEKEPDVRRQIELILGYMRSTQTEMQKVSAALFSTWQQSRNTEERAAIIDVISNVPAAESVTCIQKIFLASANAEEDRIAAAAGLFKLTPRIDVDSSFVRHVTERLRSDAKTSPNEQVRLEAARVLAAAGQNNKEFLSDLLNIESAPEVRRFLLLASQEFPTH